MNLELKALPVTGADLEALGFTALPVALNPDGEGLTYENEVPAIAEIAVTIAGDIWCLGPHRVGCGDSTDANTVKALLAGVAPMLMVSDPPYGVAYDPQWRHRAGVNKASVKCVSTSGPTGQPPGRCSPAPLRMSGMGPCTPPR